MFRIEPIPSPANDRTFPCGVWVPDGCPLRESGLSILLHGREREAEAPTLEEAAARFTDIDRIQAIADAHRTLVVKPILGNYAHLDSPIDPRIRHATFLGRELVPWLVGHLGLHHDRSRSFIAGFSMGGTGAVNILARYPEVFSVGVNFGGNTDPAFQAIARGVVPPAANVLGPYPASRAHYAEWSNERAIELLSRRTDVALGFACGVEDERLAWVRRSHRTACLHGLTTAYQEFPGGHRYNWRFIAAQFAIAELLFESLALTKASPVPPSDPLR
jgi:hypothetical protein